jgi:hypothetical protein
MISSDKIMVRPLGASRTPPEVIEINVRFASADSASQIVSEAVLRIEEHWLRNLVEVKGV